MAVRTTPTATDALAERKKILEENTLLVQQRDTLRREVGQWIEAKNAVMEYMKVLGVNTVEKERLGELLSSDFMEQREALRYEIRELEKKCASRQAEVNGILEYKNALDNDIETRRQRIVVLDGDIEHKLLWFQTEHRDNAERIKSQTNELGLLSAQLASIRSEMQDTKRAISDKTEWMLSEEKRLATRARDLAIYENRIRKAAQLAKVDVVL